MRAKNIFLPFVILFGMSPISADANAKLPRASIAPHPTLSRTKSSAPAAANHRNNQHSRPQLNQPHPVTTHSTTSHMHSPAPAAIASAPIKTRDELRAEAYSQRMEAGPEAVTLHLSTH